MNVCRLAAGLLAALVIGATGAATAPQKPGRLPAKPLSSTRTPPAMEVTIVRAATPGCSPNCPEWISANGMITAGTVARFKIVLERLGDRKLPVLLNSLGGSVPDAYAIGRLIRKNGLDVAVGETEYLPCHDTEKECSRLKKEGIRFGTPHTYNAKCVSACPFLLAAGVRRLVGRNAIVGVHEFASYQTTIRILRKYQVTTKKSFWGPDKQSKKLISEKKVGESTERVATRAADYEKARKYFVEMGVSESIMALVHKARHESLHVLTVSELKSTGLMTEAAPVDALFAAATEPATVKSEVPAAEPAKAAKKIEPPKKSAAIPTRKRSAKVAQ